LPPPGQIAGDFDRRILGLLPESRRRDVEFLPPVPPAALPGLIARHDIGLALEQPDIVNRDLTITNKILQYLGGGLAIVATPTAGQREVMANAPEAGVLESFADPVAASGVLDALLADRNALAARRAAARRLAENRYCWEQEAPNLVRLAEHALSQPWTGSHFTG
jgi:glycosyltransferase involved in cell wall biosynthesis